jgi:copper chaperone
MATAGTRGTHITIQAVDITPRGTTPAASGGCSCCGPRPDAHEGSRATPVGRVASELAVAGMTCGQGVDSVTSELLEFPGVTGVEARLREGASLVTVTAAGPLSEDDVRSAVGRAGYRLV